MGKVLIKFFGTLRLALACQSVALELDTPLPLHQVLDRVETLLGPKGEAFRKKIFQDGNLCQGVIILRNGTNVLHLEGLDTLIQPEDTLAIFPPGGGG